MRLRNCEPTTSTGCTDTCRWAGDGECDDGGAGASYAVCAYGTDCMDCGVREDVIGVPRAIPVEEPRGGILLLHGLTDSPYSLRALGTTLHELGYHVVGLRLPGHGTAPSGLKHIHWQDMAAAVRLAVAHLASKVGKKPIHLAG